VDWLHADAEQLLTLTNIVEVVGLKLTFDAYANGKAPDPPIVPLVPAVAAIGVAAIVYTYVAAGGVLDAHTPYLGGLGDLPAGLWSAGFAEPANALSIPTWVIHISSLLEWLVAMGLVWRIGTLSGNGRWKGLTWAMIPSHTSGVCACVYHFFYNADSVAYVVLLQAFFTFLGNTTLAFAAWRLAASNGWLASDAIKGVGDAIKSATAVLPGMDEGTSTAATVSSPPAYEMPSSEMLEAAGTLPSLALPTLVLWSVFGSYLVKYGETLLPVALDANVAPYLAGVMIAGATSLNVWKWSQRSSDGAKFEGLI